MSRERFDELVGEIATDIQGYAVDSSLTAHLNAHWPSDGSAFAELRDFCAKGERDGWLMARKRAGSSSAAGSSPAGSPATSASTWCA